MLDCFNYGSSEIFHYLKNIESDPSLALHNDYEYLVQAMINFLKTINFFLIGVRLILVMLLLIIMFQKVLKDYLKLHLKF